MRDRARNPHTGRFRKGLTPSQRRINRELEAEERRLDLAEAALRAAMRSEDPHQRLQAAAQIARAAGRLAKK